jgi:hypothetical protein
MARFALVLIAMALSATAAPAQETAGVLRGRVELSGQGLAGVSVTLHTVTQDTSGAVAAAMSGAAGVFEFMLPAPDTAGFTVYFATAEHLGVRYFGAPVHPGDTVPGYAVVVYDTATAVPGAVRLARRDLVLVPHPDGGWEVNEVIRISNPTDRTLVPPPGIPGWGMRLPPSAEGFQTGGEETPADQVRLVGDIVSLTASLPPGERDLLFRYRLPGGEPVAPLNAGVSVDSMNVFVQQPSARLTISGMRPTDMITARGERFLQLSATNLAADAELRLEWEADRAPFGAVPAGLGAAALVLALGLAAAVRNRSR